MWRAALWGGLSGAGALGTSLVDPLPLTEYYSRTLKEYTGLKWNEITLENAQRMIRVKKLEDAQFRELVREGYPFIVDDCATEAQLKDIPCSEYGRRWPKEHMRAEYTPGQEHINLEDPTWYTVQKPAAVAPMHLSQGKPLSGPYIWHVKDETEDPRTKPTIARMFTVPYFLNRSALNRHEAQDSFEFWFVLENGGSQAHADAYCETTVSLQLRGRKLWRLGAFPNITNAFQPYSFHDAEIYRHEEFWRPEHQEWVGPGECIVFPMGYVHETYVPEGEGGEDGCSVASTFQMQDPQPVHQWKNFLTRWGLSHYAREEPCIERMEPYVSLSASGKVRAGNREKLLKSCGEAFRAVDSDGDGNVTLAELEPMYAGIGFRPPWTEADVRQSRELLLQVAVEKATWMAEDALLYHDANRDGAITLEEFQASALKFAAVKERLRAIRRLRKDRSKLYDKEREWIKAHLCAGDADCALLQRLERDFGRTSRGARSEL